MRRFFKLVVASFVLCLTLNFNQAKAQVNVTDSLALVALYNATDGSNWTNNTNWLTGTVDTWFGVTVVGSNVEALDLSDNNLVGILSPELGNLANLTLLQLGINQLSGPIPVELGNLVNLNELYLDNNQFTSLPDLTPLSLLTSFDVHANNFTFEDIEPNLSVSGIIYSPQNLIGIADTFLLNQGDTISLSIPVGGSANQYQWQKDGVDISGATNDFLDLVNVDTTDNGVYKLLITSSIVTGLVLESADILVNVAGTTPSDYYWVGDGGVWTDVSHWSSTSGGVADKIALPGKFDNVFFDANSFSTAGQVVSIPDNGTSLGVVFRTMDWTGVTNNPTFQIVVATSPWIGNYVYGSLFFDPNMTLDFSGAEFYFVGDQDYFIDTKDLYLGDNCWLWINAPEPDAGGVSDVVCNVLSDINPAGFYINKGTFNLNGHNLYEKDSYVWIAGDSSTLDITGSLLDISTFYLNQTTVGATLIDDNATVRVSTLLRTNGLDFNHVVLTDSAIVRLYPTSFDTLEIAPGANVQFESEVTQNVGELILQGTSLLPITISATKLDTAAIINKSTGRVDASHVSLKDNTAVGGALFNAYSSIDLGNTTGWNFRNNSAQDSLALLALFNATGGPGWVNNTNWNTAEPFGTWYGVTVDDSSRVSRISLGLNNLNGTIPPEIGDLTELKYLWLGSNVGLAGTIPSEIGQLQNLDTLAFSYTSLTGSIPDELYNLTNLIRFSMSNSQVTGQLSPRVANLTNLKHIALWNTPLSGDIPNEFWDMTQLERIYLGTNAQGGEISPKIGEFTNLDEFWISNSNLSGEIPPEIGQATTTTLLNLYNNKLTGPVPDEINNLRELKRFEIQSNELDYLPEIMGLNSLQIFKISDNKFTYADILPNQDLITDNTSQKPFGDSVQVQAYTFEGLRLDPGLEKIEGQQYQWYKDNVALPDGTGHYYIIDDFREGDGGVYYLTVSHPDIDSLTLTRNPMVVSENAGDPPKPQAVKVISPNGDGINDEMTIKNIEFYPEHRVLIYDVLGRLVYFTTEYDNINNPFIGIGNQNGFKELPSGTYYYLIDVGDTKKNGTGFFVMKLR